jgi:short-subunit dehydrogenase
MEDTTMMIPGKLALITGASSGIGEATAKAIAQKGARVVLVARSTSQLERVAQEIREAKGKADFFAVDLSQPQAVSGLTHKVMDEIGVPDIIVNNAGAGRWLTIEETEAAELEKMMALPYFAAFNLTRELLPFMRKRGSGHVVNVTSVAARLSWPGAAGYAAARAAMVAFSEALATEARGTGINVTLAMFGKVASPFWRNNPGSEDRLPKVDAYLPTLKTEKVADSIVRAIERNAGMIVLPKAFRFLFLVKALTPKTTSRVLSMGWKKGT